MASIYRSVGLPLPTTMPRTTGAIEKSWIQLLAKIMPFSLVIDERTAEGDEARVSKTSVCGSWGPVAGTLRFFADKFGVARAAIEGTQIPRDLVRALAHGHEPRLVYDPSQRERPFAIERKLTYFGFELEREREAVTDFPPGMEEEARQVLAEAMARGEARHPAVPRNRPYIDEVREVWRRSGGRTARVSQAELTAWYAKQLASVTGLAQFRSMPLEFDAEEWVPRSQRMKYLALPNAVMIRERPVPLHYEVEETPEGPRGVVRLHMPEKLARTLVREELPSVDRPMRFAIARGARGTIKTDTLEEALEELSRPWMREEANGRRGRDRDHGRRDERRGPIPKGFKGKRKKR
jgi:hypothetical protein